MAKPFTRISSLAIPLDQANVDTDAIIPKQFLKSIKRSGFGKHLFDSWRYLDNGEMGENSHQRKLNPEFVLNKAEYQGANILLARENFGCGSSREHAPWALLDYGIFVIIAPSFADIFYNNCFKNGLLPIVLDADIVDWLFHHPSEILAVDLVQQSIAVAQRTLKFEVESERRHRLLNGLDDIDLTLNHQADIRAFEAKYHKQYPWL